MKIKRIITCRIQVYLSKALKYLIPNVLTPQLISVTTTIPTMTLIPFPFTAERMRPATVVSTTPKLSSMTKLRKTQSLEGYQPMV
jgi:hypothetical protein